MTIVSIVKSIQDFLGITGYKFVIIDDKLVSVNKFFKIKHKAGDIFLQLLREHCLDNIDNNLTRIYSLWKEAICNITKYIKIENREYMIFVGYDIETHSITLSINKDEFETLDSDMIKIANIIGVEILKILLDFELQEKYLKGVQNEYNR